MEDFPTLYSFMIFTKGWTYVLMGVALVGFLGYWRFLFGRDERSNPQGAVVCTNSSLVPCCGLPFSSS